MYYNTVYHICISNIIYIYIYKYITILYIVSTIYKSPTYLYNIYITFIYNGMCIIRCIYNDI